MIEPMQRVIILAAASAQESLLHELRCLGVLHLMPVTPQPPRTLEALAESIRTLEQALSLPNLPGACPGDNASGVPEASASRGLAVARDLLETHRESAQITQELAKWRALREAQTALGPFDPREIQTLRAQGVFVRLHVCTPREFAAIERSNPVLALARRHGEVIFAHVSQAEAARVPLREVPLPEFSLGEIDRHMARCNATLAALQRRLDSLHAESGMVRESLRFHQDALAFEQARAGMGADRAVCYIRGFCPTQRVPEISAAAMRHGWAVLVTDPVADDPAPTLLKHTRWEAWFQPVLKFTGITPGYREPDVSGVMLVFFTLFVGMIIGDAGYGLVMLATTRLMARHYPATARHELPLLNLLSLATIVWGALTGMWFGIRSWAELPVLRSLIVPGLNAFNADSGGLMRLCLVLGAVHLSVAHAIAALRRRSWHACGELGWICILWGVLGVCDWLLLGTEHRTLIPVALGAGAILVVGFGEPGPSGFWSNLRNGIVNLPLNLLSALGCFSDLLSYIRLFAVGLATKEVATVFNAMTSQIGLDSPLAVMGSVLIAALGHSLNLALAVLGIMVHGLRLNLLEFSRHLNMVWDGIPYAPFGFSDTHANSRDAHTSNPPRPI